MDKPGAVAGWIAERREALTGRHSPLALSASKEWGLSGGALVHRTGGFFSITGVRMEAPGQAYDGQCFPLIDQPEIGLLGFLVRRTAKGTKWLLQAKSEPGTTGWVQAGPTVQATRSNYLRRHGGKATLFRDHFMAGGETELAGLLHSEQGSSFLDKFNCNAIVEVADDVATPHPSWRWFGEAELRMGLGEDFLINTDARSVIVSHGWARLRGDAPLFTGAGHAGPRHAVLRDALARSWAAGDDGRRVRDALARLEARRETLRQVAHRVAIDALPGWRLRDDGLYPESGEATRYVRLYSVLAPEREVEAWDQPLMASTVQHRCGLVLGEMDGLLRLGLRFSVEPGFRTGVQFGPSFQSDGQNTPDMAAYMNDPERLPVLAVRQSDEGGRFMTLATTYEIHHAGPVDAGSGGLTWFNMAEAERLCATEGCITNEARSAISLLLSLA